MVTVNAYTLGKSPNMQWFELFQFVSLRKWQRTYLNIITWRSKSNNSCQSLKYIRLQHDCRIGMNFVNVLPFILISYFGYWNVINSSLEDTLPLSENVTFLLNVVSGASSNTLYNRPFSKQPKIQIR